MGNPCLSCKDILVASNDFQFLVAFRVGSSDLHLAVMIQEHRSGLDSYRHQAIVRCPTFLSTRCLRSTRRLLYHTFRSPSQARLVFLLPSNNLTARMDPREGRAGALAIVNAVRTSSVQGDPV